MSVVEKKPHAKDLLVICMRHYPYCSYLLIVKLFSWQVGSSLTKQTIKTTINKAATAIRINPHIVSFPIAFQPDEESEPT